MPSKTEPKVLVDADVVSHFLQGGGLPLLNAVFPNRLVMLSQVEEELREVRKFKNTIDNFICFCKVEQLKLPNKGAITLEYAQLLRTFGKGESACMALARHRGNYIASSNLRDIKTYCTQHQITYYTTSDILHVAFTKKYITEADCDAFIAKVLAAGSKMPYATYQHFKQANGL
jgi:predicted nucleic acid-binding protein